MVNLPMPTCISNFPLQLVFLLWVFDFQVVLLMHLFWNWKKKKDKKGYEKNGTKPKLIVKYWSTLIKYLQVWVNNLFTNCLHILLTENFIPYLIICKISNKIITKQKLKSPKGPIPKLCYWLLLPSKFYSNNPPPPPRPLSHTAFLSFSVFLFLLK